MYIRFYLNIVVHTDLHCIEEICVDTVAALPLYRQYSVVLCAENRSCFNIYCLLAYTINAMIIVFIMQSLRQTQ
jgi:hypothetical protein